MATAQVLFQRYFYAKSFVKHDMEMLSMSAIWLASKIEEEPRRARDVINVYVRIRQVRDDLEMVPVVVDEAYKRKKDDLVKAERFMLKELGFCVHVKHPHKLVVIICKQVMRGLCADSSQEDELVQTSWNFMNDSFRSRHLFVKYPPEKIACGCIFLASRVLGIATPCQPYWFEVLEAEPHDIFQIAQHIMSLYTFEKIPINELLETVRNTQATNRKQKMEARKRRHDDQLAKITAAQEAAKAPENAAEEAAKMACKRLVDNSRNGSKSRSGSKVPNSNRDSRSPLVTAKDGASKGGNVYVNPATQINNIAGFGNQFDQPERVGVIYKPQNLGNMNGNAQHRDAPQNHNSQEYNAQTEIHKNKPGIKDFHSGKMLEQITKENVDKNTCKHDKSEDEDIPTGFSGYTRRNSSDGKRQQRQAASSSETSDSSSSGEEERKKRKKHDKNDRKVRRDKTSSRNDKSGSREKSRDSRDRRDDRRDRGLGDRKVDRRTDGGRHRR